MDKTLLEQLKELINVDCDTFDTDFIKRMPIRFHDQTSNPKVIHGAITWSNNTELVETVIKELKGQPWDDVYATSLARIAAQTLPLISGRVLSQTSPSFAYDKDFILFDARRRYKAYVAAGVPPERIAIKIATTTAGVQAAKILADEGISTLGTLAFSVPQALAAAQAGMFAVSMWYNGPFAHSSSELWHDVPDPISDHPMSARHLLIRDAYDLLKERTGREQPQMKTCSFVSPREVMAAPALGANHVTLGQTILQELIFSSQLAKFQPGLWKVPVSDQVNQLGFAWEDWSPPTPGKTAAHIAAVKAVTLDSELWPLDVNYLADGLLDKLIAEDELTCRMLQTGLSQFGAWETKSKEFIEGVQARLI